MRKTYFRPDMSGVLTEVPVEYRHNVSGFDVVVWDGDVPIGWGFACNGRAMVTERWKGFPGDRVCVGIRDAPGGMRVIGEWVYVTRWLTPSEAIGAYGSISYIKVGVRGGFKEVRYGETVFRNRVMDPRGKVEIPQRAWDNGVLGYRGRLGSTVVSDVTVQGLGG